MYWPCTPNFTGNGPIFTTLLTFRPIGNVTMLPLLLAYQFTSMFGDVPTDQPAAGKYAEAAAALEPCVRSEKADTSEYQQSAVALGQSYFMLSKAPQAIPWLEKLPDSTEANYMLGYAYLQNGRPDQSEVAFARLFRQQPDSARGHLVAAQMMLKKDYDQEAARELEIALKLDGSLPQAHFLLGEIDIFRGRFDLDEDLVQRRLSEQRLAFRRIIPVPALGIAIKSLAHGFHRLGQVAWWHVFQFNSC